MSDVSSILGLGSVPQDIPSQRNQSSGGASNFNNNMLKDDDPQFPQAPQLFVAFSINKGTPPDVTERICTVMTALVKSRFSIRYKVTGDPATDLGIVNTMNGLRSEHNAIEIIVPWKDYGVEYLPQSSYITKPPYTTKRVAAALTQRWADSKVAVRSFRAAETHLVLGRGGSSRAIALLTWSRDGASSMNTLTDETKYSKFMYRIATMMNTPILNLHSSDALDRLEQELAKYPYLPE